MSASEPVDPTSRRPAPSWAHPAESPPSRGIVPWMKAAVSSMARPSAVLRLPKVDTGSAEATKRSAEPQLLCLHCQQTAYGEIQNSRKTSSQRLEPR